MESFVNGSADEGFIIVNFGSILKGIEILGKVHQIFVRFDQTFGRLKQRVVWKWEDEKRLNPIVHPNVNLLSWLPQQNLLGHPKARLLITHGILFRKQEAVYHVVPFIALTVFTDQPINAQKGHVDGYAIRLDWDHLTLYNAIQQILHNSRFTFYWSIDL